VSARTGAAGQHRAAALQPVGPPLRALAKWQSAPNIIAGTGASAPFGRPRCGALHARRSGRMPSVVEDFAYIAKRVAEIRTARYQELGVSPPTTPERPQAPARQSAAEPSNGGGFRYAPGFEYLAGEGVSVDDWDCSVAG
jgi:hypothetical protein